MMGLVHEYSLVGSMGTLLRIIDLMALIPTSERIGYTIKQIGQIGQTWQRRILASFMVIVVAIASSGCSLESFKTSAAQTSQIVYSSISEPKTFNPVLNDVVTVIFGLIFEGLLTENGMTGELEPALAESWDIAPDQKSIVFTLREGLKWSDGEPFSVDDILFTYNDVLFNPQIPSGLRDILRIGEEGAFPTVTKLSDRQVKFSVPEPFAPFLRYAGGISILPKHALEDSVSTMDGEGNPRFFSMWGTDTDPNEVIGNGPYRITSYVPGERMIFERNPNYWRIDEQQQAQPYIDRFVVQIVESTDASLLQFRSGGLDVYGISDPKNFPLLKREETQGNFTIYEDGPRPGTSFITFNLNTGRRQGKPLVDPIKSKWFNTQEFRQAVSYAIDRQTMINNLFQGLGEPQISPISVQSPYYAAPEDGIKTYDYDLETAKELLASVGFTYQGQKLVDSEGNPVRFALITNTGNKLRESMGAQIKRDLSRIGIQVDFQLIDFNTLVERVSNSLEWDCLLLGFSGGAEPNSGSNIWKTDGQLHVFNQKPGEGQEPLEGRQVYDWEERISQLYVQGAQELDEEARRAIYIESQRLTQEYLPFIYLVNSLSLGAIRNTIDGVQYSALYGALWNLHELEMTSE